jgi:DNA adenine methylase
MVKPVLKWVGGKTQILDHVMSHVPKKIQGNYHEPFVGGGSVLLKVLEEVEINGTVHASDINPHLIGLYWAIQRDPVKLIRDVEHIGRELTELEYYEVRQNFLEDPCPAKFLYLNKTCFRGLYREGPRGFNVPWGHYKAPKIVDPENIFKVSRLIRDVQFEARSFDDSLTGPFSEDDFVYLDPPYVNTFADYTRGGFRDEDHERLFNMTKKIPRFLMSNSNCEKVQENFKEYSQSALECRRAINSRNPGATASELLVFTC